MYIIPIKNLYNTTANKKYTGITLQPALTTS